METLDRKIMKKIEKLIKNYNKVYDSNITFKQVFSKKRNANIVRLRHIIFYMLYKKEKFTYVKIAEIFNKNHATIRHGVENVEFFKKHYLKYNEKLNCIMKIVVEKKDVDPLFEMKAKLDRLSKNVNEMISAYQETCTHTYPDGSSAITDSAFAHPLDVRVCDICRKEF